MDYFDLIAQRESCRNYSKEPVEMEKLVKCMEAAILSPSACNSQPYTYLVSNTPEKSEEIAACITATGMNGFTVGCPAFVIVLEEKAVLNPGAAKRFDSQRFAQMDVGMSVMQLCLAATEQGLSTCILGCYDEAMLQKLFEIPQEKKIRLVISVGYAASDALRKKRRRTLKEAVEFVK